MTPTGTTTQAFFLTEVCDLPLGLAWPTMISYDDMYASIHALKGSYAHFLHVLTTIKPILTPRLVEVQVNLMHFVLPCVSFMRIHNQGFPDLDPSPIPQSISDFHAFSPMMEMVHGFVWHLTCDAVLTTGSQEAQTALQEYLTCSETTMITGSSYHRARIPGWWCPNFAYHFKVASDWPTSPSPITELAKLNLVLQRGHLLLLLLPMILSF
jgi:hypothetical protein